MTLNPPKHDYETASLPPKAFPAGRLLKAERKKQRYRWLWTVPLGFLCVLLLWISVSIRNFSAQDLTHGYQYLLYELSLLNAIFMPIMLSVIASRLCDMEIKGCTLKLLYTLEKPGCFYDIKFLAEMKYLLYFCTGEILGILLLGKLFSITEPILLLPFAEHFLAVSCIGAVLLGFQHMLSLLSDNQILPLCVGLAGSFLGLFSMFFPRSVNLLIVWGYFSIFSVAGIDWSSVEDGTDFLSGMQYLDFPVMQFILFLIVGIILYLIEKEIFKRKEV